MNRKRFVIRNCYECSRNCTFHCFLHTSAGFRQASDGSATSAALSATANRQVQITVQLSTAAATAPALPAASRQPPGTPVAPQRRSLRSQIESQCLASARSLALLRSHYSHNSIRDSTKSSRTPCGGPALHEWQAPPSCKLQQPCRGAAAAAFTVQCSHTSLSSASG